MGCGFGGLLVGLAPVLPDTLCLGMEIRAKVTEYVRLRILALRNGVPPEPEGGRPNPPRGGGQKAADAAESGSEPAISAGAADNSCSSDAASVSHSSATSASSVGPSSSSSSSDATTAMVPGAPRPYDNISVLKTNAMRYLTSFFARGQLAKLFFCFPDPHFKKSNHRRRIVSTPLLADYAYVLRPGGRLYTITDVRDLHNWMAAHADAHPAFRRLSAEELANDPCVEVMRTYTEEGKKVERLQGDKHIAVFVRLTDDEARAKAASSAPDFWSEPTVHYEWTPAPSQAVQSVLREKAEARRGDKAAKASGSGGTGASSSAAAANSSSGSGSGAGSTMEEDAE